MNSMLSNFLMILSSAVNTYFNQDINPKNEPITSPVNELKAEYDFIIVGSGTSGSILGRRLSENKHWNVLLLEAGGVPDYLVDVPFFFLFSAMKPQNKWHNYTSTFQSRTARANRGVIEYYPGRLMGGDSTTSAGIYNRGSQEDFNTWAKITGNKQWSYKNVLPYFIRFENVSNTNLSSKYHGRNGPQNIEFPSYKTVIGEVLLQSGKEMGFELIDYNGKSQNGMGIVQMFTKGHIKQSTSRAYLTPVRDRINLAISENSLVTKLIFNGKKVTGVVFRRNGSEYFIKANKEVILSAGAFNTPVLLMLAGIGPKEHLESLKIPVIANLPVGNNYQDHIGTILVLQVNESITLTNNIVFTNQSILQYAQNRSGPLTSNTAEILAFKRFVNNETQAPNMFSAWTNYYPTIQNEYVFLLYQELVEVKSRGTVRLRSNNINDPPIINPNFLSNPVDYQVLKESTLYFSNIINTPSLKKYSPKIYTGSFPNCAKYVNNIENFVDCLIRQYMFNDPHPVGTCSMGRIDSETTVVGPNLIVKGFENLRIVDASIMPTITRANTRAATMMIAELSSDIIKRTYAGQI